MPGKMVQKFGAKFVKLDIDQIWFALFIILRNCDVLVFFPSFLQMSALLERFCTDIVGSRVEICQRNFTIKGL